MTKIKIGDKYIEILLKNGETFAVEGENIENICTMQVTHHHGWAAFKLFNGKLIQIRAEEIAAIYECEVV